MATVPQLAIFISALGAQTLIGAAFGVHLSQKCVFENGDIMEKKQFDRFREALVVFLDSESYTEQAKLVKAGKFEFDRELEVYYSDNWVISTKDKTFTWIRARDQKGRKTLFNRGVFKTNKRDILIAEFTETDVETRFKDD